MIQILAPSNAQKCYHPATQRAAGQELYLGSGEGGLEKKAAGLLDPSPHLAAYNLALTMPV